VHMLVLTTISLHAKFELSNLTNSKDMIGCPKI